VDRYESFDALTTAMLNGFVEKILVHERGPKGSIETTQEAAIFFNFIREIRSPTLRGSEADRRGAGSPAEGRETQGQATPSLFTP
jgi:hypothetical protein